MKICGLTSILTRKNLVSLRCSIKAYGYWRSYVYTTTVATTKREAAERIHAGLSAEVWPHITEKAAGKTLDLDWRARREPPVTRETFEAR